MRISKRRRNSRVVQSETRIRILTEQPAAAVSDILHDVIPERALWDRYTDTLESGTELHLTRFPAVLSLYPTIKGDSRILIRYLLISIAKIPSTRVNLLILYKSEIIPYLVESLLKNLDITSDVTSIYCFKNIPWTTGMCVSDYKK